MATIISQRSQRLNQEWDVNQGWHVKDVELASRSSAQQAEKQHRRSAAAANKRAIGSERGRIGVRQYPAKLYSVESVNLLGGSPNYAMIHLPHLPPELTFERSAQFNSVPTMITPDGAVHIYQHTNPLEVNYDFELHYMDEYCVNGAVDLMRIASLLHALTLPFKFGSEPNASRIANMFFQGELDKQREEERVAKAREQAAYAANDAAAKQMAEMKGDNPRTIVPAASTAEIGWPPPCVLEVMGVGSRAVRMYGYLKRAVATFKEPWLQYAKGKEAFNLPSGAKYSFTFVNAPTYRNLIAGSGKITDKSTNEKAAAIEYGNAASMVFGQGSAEFVRDSFYNTLELAKYQELTSTLGVKGLKRGP